MPKNLEQFVSVNGELKGSELQPWKRRGTTHGKEHGSWSTRKKRGVEQIRKDLITATGGQRGVAVVRASPHPRTESKRRKNELIQHLER